MARVMLINCFWVAGRYKGMKIKEAREEIIKDLKSQGKIQKTEDIEHVVNVHERCDTDIEILMTEQWFIKYLDLKKDMLKDMAIRLEIWLPRS